MAELLITAVAKKLEWLSKETFPDSEPSILLQSKTLSDGPQSTSTQYASFEKFEDCSREIFRYLTEQVLGKELDRAINTVCLSDKPTVATDGWVLAWTPKAGLEVRYSKAPSQHILCHSSFTGIKNLSKTPLNIALYDNIDEIFLESSRHKLPTEKVVSIDADGIFIFDGNQQAIQFLTQGILIARISTKPLKKFDVIADKNTEKVVSRASNEMSSSSIEVLLRCFAANNYVQAEALASTAIVSNIKELRWAALNYFWRVESTLLPQAIRTLQNDKDQQLKALAKNLQSQLG